MALQRKRPMGFPNHVGLWREPRGLSPSGGKKKPSNFLTSSPARHRRAVRGAGGHPLLVGGFPVFALGDLGDEGDAESDNVLHDLLKEGGGPGGFLDGAFDDQLVVYL